MSDLDDFFDGNAVCATCGEAWKAYHFPLQAWWRCEDCCKAEALAVEVECEGMTAAYVIDSNPPEYIVTHTNGRRERCRPVEAWGANAGPEPGMSPTYRIKLRGGGIYALDPILQTELQL